MGHWSDGRLALALATVAAASGEDSRDGKTDGDVVKTDDDDDDDDDDVASSKEPEGGGVDESPSCRRRRRRRRRFFIIACRPGADKVPRDAF